MQPKIHSVGIFSPRQMQLPCIVENRFKSYLDEKLCMKIISLAQPARQHTEPSNVVMLLSCRVGRRLNWAPPHFKQNVNTIYAQGRAIIFSKNGLVTSSNKVAFAVLEDCVLAYAVRAGPSTSSHLRQHLCSSICLYYYILPLPLL